MFKFLRKIRHRLVVENRISKYMAYALGEIVLVVIGILIALQINDWNQRRIDRNTERAYLMNIINEIESNKALNKRLVIDRLSRKMEGLHLAKKYCENELVVNDTLSFLAKVAYGGVFSGGHTFGDRNAYDELINTGNLQIIEKDTIKQSIASYYGNMDAYNKRSKVHASRYSSFTSELRPFDSRDPESISKYDQIEMMLVFKTIEFRKIVDLELSYAFKIRDYIENIDAMGDETIDLIKSELKR